MTKKKLPPCGHEKCADDMPEFMSPVRPELMEAMMNVRDLSEEDKDRLKKEVMHDIDTSTENFIAKAHYQGLITKAEIKEWSKKVDKNGLGGLLQAILGVKKQPPKGQPVAVMITVPHLDNGVWKHRKEIRKRFNVRVEDMKTASKHFKKQFPKQWKKMKASHKVQHQEAKRAKDYIG